MINEVLVDYWNITGILIEYYTHMLLENYWNITASAATLRFLFHRFLITVRFLVTAKMTVILLSRLSSRSQSNVTSSRIYLDNGENLILVMSPRIPVSNK